MNDFTSITSFRCSDRDCCTRCIDRNHLMSATKTHPPSWKNNTSLRVYESQPWSALCNSQARIQAQVKLKKSEDLSVGRFLSTSLLFHLSPAVRT
jgi:hypothetical protein